MLNLPFTTNIYLGVEPVDMRKSFATLYRLIQEHLKCGPNSGAFYIFTNKARNRLKIFHFDSTGTWILAKRLGVGTYHWPKGTETQDGKISLEPEALYLLVSGIDMKDGNFRPWYQGRD